MSLSNIRIVLVGTLQSGNIGAVARAMKNMGVSDLCLVNPQASHLNRECTDRAMHSGDILKKAAVYLTLKEAVADCHHVLATTGKVRNNPMPVCSPHEMAQKWKTTYPGKLALVFGPEDTGLGNEDLKLCEAGIEIPTSPEMTSLNLSHAVIVVLYEFFLSQHLNTAPNPEIPLLPISTKEAFFDHLQETLLAIGYLDKNNPDRIFKDLKHIFNRAQLDEREVTILRGICRQIINGVKK